MRLNGAVIRLRAVVQVAAPRDEPAPWPVAQLAPYTWLALSGDCTDEELGTFVALLAAGMDVPPAASPAQMVDALLAEDLLLLAGGLEVHDTDTAATVRPGCCAGLEDWREWTKVLSGVSPWLGHDPWPKAEFLDDRLRILQDGSRPAERYIDISCSAMSGLLSGVQHDMLGFLGALRVWTQRMKLGSRGEELVGAVDQSFRISTPLDLPTVDAEGIQRCAR